MIDRLPLEIQIRLIKFNPSSCLKFINSHFYILYNELFYDRILNCFGEDVIPVLIKVLPFLKVYIKSLDVIRFTARNIISSRLGLKDVNVSHELEDDHPFSCMYIKDSWKYIHSIMKNKRLFAEYKDYEIDQPSNYVFNHYVEINRTYLLSYKKTLWLAPGRYNLNIALVVKHGSGLGTTKFEIRYEDEEKEPIHQTFYPPSNINEILPKKQFCLLKIGEFVIPPTVSSDPSVAGNKLRKVSVTMEEIGLYLKSGFRIFFIDIATPSLLFNDYNLLYYTIKETDYRYFINIPLKNLYKALNYVQNGGENAFDVDVPYGLGNPADITDEYERSYNDDYESNLARKGVDTHDSGSHNLNENIMKYSTFYFHSHFMRRFFKFSTIYQKRQFVNRYGDFELDWNEQDKSGSGECSCVYDKDSIKWKIPILGEL